MTISNCNHSFSYVKIINSDYLNLFCLIKFISQLGRKKKTSDLKKKKKKDIFYLRGTDFIELSWREKQVQKCELQAAGKQNCVQWMTHQILQGNMHHNTYFLWLPAWGALKNSKNSSKSFFLSCLIDGFSIGVWSKC